MGGCAISDLQRYIVEEWAEDYHHGRLPRRELLRRMALMAGGAALAVPLLASLGIAATDVEVAEAAASGAVAQAAAPGVTVPPDDPALEASAITIPMGTIQVLGYLARPRGGSRTPGVLVIHENRGLLEHFRDICRRLAKNGYAGLAVDLASHEGGTERFPDLAQVTTILGQTPPEQLVTMLNAGVRHLRAHPGVRRDRVGAMGFCFGGGMTWRLATQNPELRAAAPYYGPNPPLAEVPRIRAAMLAIYDALDARINAGIPAIREALQAAGVTHETHIYPEADHAFFNATGARYRREAAEDAWWRTLDWFDRFLKAG